MHANCATRRARSRAGAAAAWLAVRFGCWLLAMMFAGCVIPPSLSVDTTGRRRRTRRPRSSRCAPTGVELPEPSTVVFERGERRHAEPDALDTDLDDTLYVQLFVNYTVARPKPRARRPAQRRRPHRRAHARRADWTACASAADVGAEPLPIMQVVVFDRELESGSRAAVPGDAAPGGLSTNRASSSSAAESHRHESARSSFSLLAGCLEVPHGAGDRSATTTRDCNAAHGEVCDEGVCWGNPPTGLFAATLSPPSDARGSDVDRVPSS